jgi:hypothetical protein
LPINKHAYRDLFFKILSIQYRRVELGTGIYRTRYRHVQHHNEVTILFDLDEKKNRKNTQEGKYFQGMTLSPCGGFSTASGTEDVSPAGCCLGGTPGRFSESLGLAAATTGAGRRIPG